MQKDITKTNNFLPKAITVVAIIMVIYQLVGVFLQPLAPVYHANTHLFFVSLMLLLPALHNATKAGWKIEIVLVILLMLIGTGYMYANATRLQFFQGNLNTTDMVIGIILTVLVFEITRRGAGWPLTLIALIFVSYAFWGEYVPGPFGHLPVSLSRILTWTCMSGTDGIYGSLIFISANIIFLFMMFGVMLEITKAREFFNLIGTLVGRKLRGGSAMAATVSSGLVGMITGSPTSDAIIVGVVTIPMMKKAGFRGEVAAAVEAAAASGGIFMPPVMGAVAFMMMSLTGFTYQAIIVAAAIPAIIYFLGIGISVFFYAGRHNISRVTEEVDRKLLWRRAPLFIIPFGLIVGLLALNYPVMYCAGWAMVAGLVLGFISKETRPSLKDLSSAMTQGAKMASEIATMLIICDVAFVSMMSLTAMAPKFSILISTVSGGTPIGVLIITMFVSLLLGMVNPLGGSYLIVALITVPVLSKLGLSVMQAHFFALFMGTLGFLTPPVAPAAIVTSRIANVSYLRTCMESYKFIGGAFILPYIFAFDPVLLGNFSAGLLPSVISLVLALLIIVATPIALQQYYLTKLSWPEIVLDVASLLALIGYFVGGHNILFAVVGLALFALLSFSQIIRRNRSQATSQLSVS